MDASKETPRAKFADMKRYQLELVLLGILMGASNGNRERMLAICDSFLFNRKLTVDCYNALVNKDLGVVMQFLKRLNCNIDTGLKPTEVVVDSLRTMEAEQTARDLLDSLAGLGIGNVDTLRSKIQEALDILPGKLDATQVQRNES